MPMQNAIAEAADRLTADLREQPPGPWPTEVYIALHAMTRQAVQQLGHLTMTYQCEDCQFHWEVWCALGCEGPPELKELGLAMAVPFVIGCPAWKRKSLTDSDDGFPAEACGGQMTHVRWSDDRVLAPPQLIPEDAARFVLPDNGGDQMCGRLEIPTPALVRARRAWESDDSTQNSDAS